MPIPLPNRLWLSLLLLAGLAAVTYQDSVRVMPEPRRAADLVKAHVLPDPKLTPGAILSDVTDADVARPGYSAGVRDVDESLKRRVFREYGIDPDKVRTGDYEIDHCCELSIGGANDIHNLWPELRHLNYHGRDMGAIEKDKAEVRVLAMVREHKTKLADAQRQLTEDWTVLYRKIVAPEFPVYHK